MRLNANAAPAESQQTDFREDYELHRGGNAILTPWPDSTLARSHPFRDRTPGDGRDPSRQWRAQDSVPLITSAERRQRRTDNVFAKLRKKADEIFTSQAFESEENFRAAKNRMREEFSKAGNEQYLS